MEKENKDHIDTTEFEQSAALGFFLILSGFSLWLLGILEAAKHGFQTSDVPLFTSLWILYTGIIMVVSFYYKDKCFLFRAVNDFCRLGLKPVGQNLNSLYFGIGAIVLGMIFLFINIF